MSGENLSISEAHEASAIVGISRPEGSIEKVNLATIPQSQDYIFITLFLAYYGDLEGKHGIVKFSGELHAEDRVVPIEEKREDVIRLNEYYTKWNKFFASNRHKDQILNLVINEVNGDLKEIDKLLAIGKIDSNEYNYKRKGTILLSKFIYLKVARIFEDLGVNEIVIPFNGAEIEITPWSMVHILNRHYAGIAKQYDSGKSFHTDQNLMFLKNQNSLRKLLSKSAAITKQKIAVLNTSHLN